jgi:hypothetical protein
MQPNIEILEAVCWDYDINTNDVYYILTTKDDSSYPALFEILRYKVLKYISIDKLKNIFTSQEIYDIFSDIKVSKIRNPITKQFLISLLNVNQNFC